jgi:hypothetical protein
MTDPKKVQAMFAAIIAAIATYNPALAVVALQEQNVKGYEMDADQGGAGETIQ